MNSDKSSTHIDIPTHTFMQPEKQIKLPNDIPRWEKSQAYSDLLGFILALNEAVKNKKIRDQYHSSPLIEKLVNMLDQLDKWIDEIPPIDQPQRFGNKAFRTWFNKLKEEGPNLLKQVLPPEYEPAIPELFTYVIESVGNDTRIDYGTGHELSMVAFLCCLCKLGAFKEEDYTALVLKIFERYMYLMRKLQLTYRMEPAGSHGVWSLDDYQFLPFLWGSSQLLDHPRIKPKSFPNEDIYNGFYKDFIFLSAIKFINQVKTGPFAEHSNQLWGISGVGAWSKVNSGLIKMYRAEILAKFPIVQHFMFGSLLTLEPSTNPPPQQEMMPPPSTTMMPPVGDTSMPPPTTLARPL
ncbi:serine/threonine-protein phosphatase 2A activator-like [Physella acuta]|uniref:serine/threonine-protein phosphatase 2A activator-like n=1 Tax=Physella acuta TaxID=109671 RepID=UPI0027DB2B59|nr:serine/threonine-protein phosphatase 2A activator-like [Physella acuta]